MAEIHVNMKQLNKWKVYSDNVIAYDQIIQSKGKFFTNRPKIYTQWLDEFGIFYTLKGSEKEIRKTNPAKRALKNAPSARVGKTRKQYVSRPSQAPGHKAPTKRLKARRKLALVAPKGYFPNPIDVSKEKEILKALETEMKRLKGYFPYRIIWGGYDPETGDFESGAVATMRIPNAQLRKGWKVFKL